MKHIIWLLSVLVLLLSCDSKKNAPFLEDQFDKAVAFNDNVTAVYYLHELRALDPDNNSVYVRMADLYSKLGNYRGALTAADMAYAKANELERKDLIFVRFRAKKALRENEKILSR